MYTVRRVFSCKRTAAPKTIVSPSTFAKAEEIIAIVSSIAEVNVIKVLLFYSLFLLQLIN